MIGDVNDYIFMLYNLIIEKDVDRIFNLIRKRFFFKCIVVEWVISIFNLKL